MWASDETLKGKEKFAGSKFPKSSIRDITNKLGKLTPKGRWRESGLTGRGAGGVNVREKGGNIPPFYHVEHPESSPTAKDREIVNRKTEHKERKKYGTRRSNAKGEKEQDKKKQERSLAWQRKKIEAGDFEQIDQIFRENSSQLQWGKASH